MFTVADILTRVQRTFGDESGVQVTEADVIRWINDAQREVVMQHAGLLITNSTINLVAGQADYALPSNCFTLESVSLKDSATATAFYHLRWIPRESMDMYIGDWRGSNYSSASPTVYTSAPNNSITIFPTPTVSVAGGISLTYARYANDLVTSADALDLPQYYHSYIEHFCMMKAYEKDEDWDSADRKAQLVQSTMDFNNGREAWFGRESYPSIQPLPEDLD